LDVRDAGQSLLVPLSPPSGVGEVDKLTSQEAVKLHEDLEVHIVALGSLAVGVPHVVTDEINTYSHKNSKRGFPISLPGLVCSD
jgi:hypothetical protein